MLHVSKTDQVRCDMLLKALTRAKFELEGSEVPAMTQVLGWAAELKARIDVALAQAAMTIIPPAATPETEAKEKKKK
jgi:hypothetical protein